jgi:class 3 adenylate cyclase
MSRADCVSNRNTRIIATYVKSLKGGYKGLFNDLPFPSDRYITPDDFFLNEDEWSPLEVFHHIFRRAKEMVDERYFYFRCGASAAILRSWGRFEYFSRIFSSPSDGIRKVPFFNKNFNDTKDIEIIVPPTYDRSLGKIRSILKIQYHEDIDVHGDYIDNPYVRGIISSIPTIWGLEPADVKQPVHAYDPEILLNEVPEFSCYHLNARMVGDHLMVDDPDGGGRKVVGEKITYELDMADWKRFVIGRYHVGTDSMTEAPGDRREAILITETVRIDEQILLKEGEIFGAPYFILEVTYDRRSFLDRLYQMIRLSTRSDGTAVGLIETIDRLRESIEARNRAYHALEQANSELKEAKKRVDDYAKSLEQKVDERTTALKSAQAELMILNRDLEAKVKSQVEKLKNYDELRRYLSPKITERILSSGEPLGAEPQRKMMTVLFSDIRNFSDLTDSLEPEEIFDLLNRYLSEMTKLIYEFDGTLNKIVGDGLLVFFGDPIAVEDHAERSVLLAIQMQRKVASLRKGWRYFGHPLEIGIGINSGFMTVGNIGSDIHKDYTVIGNQVNVAARLESLAKPGQILISRRTMSRVKGLVDAEMVGEIHVKGIHYPVTTYNVKVT